MRRKSFRGAWLMVAWMALAPAMAWGQNPGATYAPMSSPLPLPIGSTRPEDGGFFVDAQFTFFTMSNPLKAQPVAVRGFRDRDGSVTGVVDTFVGSGQQALNVAQLTGQDTYVPGTNLGFGWKFKEGSSISVNFLMFAEANYKAGATLSPRAGVLDQALANSFLYADVFNIPIQYSGPDNKIVLNNPPNGVQPSAQAAFGIWNGASIMTIQYTQRFQQWDMLYRESIFETETYRLNGLVGPRFAWIWDRFAWRTTDLTATGQSGPQDVALYSNVTSNRMYGATAGCEQEYYLGHGIVMHLKVQGSMFVDIVKEASKYESGDRFNGTPGSKLGRKLYSVVPEAEAELGFMWYPTEYMQLYAGYQAMGFLNTLAARRPIDFDFVNVNPHYSHTARFFEGFHAGHGFTF